MLKLKSLFLLVAAVGLISGCSTGLLGGDELPASSNQPSAPPPPLVVDGVRTSYADVVERTSAAVVRIEAEHKNRAQQGRGTTPFGDDDFFRQFQMPNQRPQIERGLGSGVIVSADGTILTNAHVIDG